MCSTFITPTTGPWMPPSHRRPSRTGNNERHRGRQDWIDRPNNLPSPNSLMERSRAQGHVRSCLCVGRRIRHDDIAEMKQNKQKTKEPRGRGI